MDKPKATAKDFFLWFGAMLALYWSVISFILLTFDYISYAFPNALAYYPENPYQSGISYEMASIIILLPVAFFLMSLIRKDMAKDPSRKEIWVRRWGIILTLFVAGVAIVVDLITLLTTFLSGEELTLSFLLKVLVVILVAAGVFMHFIADLWGYWSTYPARRNYVVVGVGILALVTIVSGFFIVGTPAQARLARFDSQRVSDLQELQSRVTTYYQAKQKLPATLSDIDYTLSFGNLPVDPQTGESYIYSVVDDSDHITNANPGFMPHLSFVLCATFSTQRHGTPLYARTPVIPSPATGAKMSQDAWEHGAGPVCFDRAIDPSFYPPSK